MCWWRWTCCSTPAPRSTGWRADRAGTDCQRTDRALPQAPAVGAVAGGRGVAADGAGPDPDPVRAGAAAGMAGRPAGGPGGAQRALAHVRREPGVRAHDPADGAGDADPGAPRSEEHTS